jgi:hypothetical protein
MLFRAQLIALITALTACTESHPTEEDAGGITFDANFPDAGMDAGPPPSNIGAACNADSECQAPADLCVPDFPGGYCSVFCGSSEDCGDGAICVQFGMQALCLSACEPGENQCREGYGCSLMAGGGCLPGCEDASDCGEGQECDLNGGFGGAGQCYDPEASIGDECTSDGECTEGGLCRVPAEGWPGGSCTIFGCDFENNNCPSGSECVVTGRFPSCVDDCATSADCRTGYSCYPTLGFADRLTCQPTFDADSLGAACSQRRDPCLGGFCLREADYGFPDSYCIALGCDPDGTPTGCPGDGACFETAGGTGVCFEGCTTTMDCRTGYTCRPSDSSDPESPLGCLPGCESDSECANDEFVCNTGTGLCGEPFVPGNLGEPCSDADDCVGGTCLTEGDEGWPAGTCVYAGCRLSGTGMMATCPTGGVCTDDGAGDPTLGVCVDSCVVGGTTCRPGYACVAIDPSGAEPTAGACRPACTSDGECGAGNTCSEETGLCS